MALNYDEDGVPNIMHAVYKYFETPQYDEKMWEIVNNLVIEGAKESEFIKISRLVKKNRPREEIVRTILEIYKPYQKREEKTKITFKEAPKEPEKVPQAKKGESKEQINARQKRFKARRAEKNMKRVSFYVPEEIKAKMDGLREKTGISQEKMFVEMANWYFQKFEKDLKEPKNG